MDVDTTLPDTSLSIRLRTASASLEETVGWILDSSIIGPARATRPRPSGDGIEIRRR